MKKKYAVLIALILAGLPALAGAQAIPPKKAVASPSPSLTVSGRERAADWNQGFPAVYRTLLMNLHGPNWYFHTRYAYPSPTFRGVYLWDTAFISQVWKPWDVATAEEVNFAVLDHAEAGRLRHFSSPWDKSQLTQPPVMTWSVGENFLWSGDREYLARAYPILKDYNRWLYENRRLPCGLFFWSHPYESGIDNSPRFGSTDESRVVDMASLAAVDLSSYIVRQNEALARMAATLGFTDDAAAFAQKADELRGLINDRLWDPETGYYYDRDTKSDRLVKIRTIASFFPLFAGVPSPERAKILRDHIMDPAEFNTPMPLPSVARDDPSFEKDCWRGPIWINTAYLVIVGLERYGFADEAAELSFKLVDGVYRTYANTGRLVEFYDPDRFDFRELHRKRGNLYKRLTLGDKPRPNFVGWTGLVNTLVIEHLIGFHKEPGKRWLAPNFPPAAKGLSVRLVLPAENLTIELTVLDAGATSGQVTAAGAAKPFSLARGMRLDL